MRSTRSLVLALSLCAGVAGAVAVAEPAVLRAGDDPIKLREAREKFKKAQTDKGISCYQDLCFGIDKGPKDKPKLDTRWSFETASDSAAKESGIQISGGFSDIKFPEGSGIRMSVQKFVHKPTPTSETTVTLPNAGKSPKAKDKQDMIEAFYEEDVKSSKEVIKDRCVAPKKVKAGVAELMCSVVGVPSQGAPRERKDRYIWIGDKGSATYVMTLTFTGVCESKPELAADKVDEMLKAHKELKAPD